MSYQTFDASPTARAVSVTAEAALPQSSQQYFQALHNLIVNCEVSTQDGTKLSLDQGTKKTLALVNEIDKAGKKIMLVGNGGSAAIASHEALDFWKAGGVKAMAFNDPAQLTCLGNDCGYENIFAKAIEMFAEEGDMLIAISSSGKSPSILNSVRAARLKGCSVITYSGFAADTPLRAVGDINYYITSTSYGHVEVAHLSLIHYLTDAVVMQKRGMK